MAFTNLSERATGFLVTAAVWNELVNNWLTVATSAGLVKHEFGGLEVDVSAITTGGIFRGASSGVVSILADFLDGSGRVKQEMGGIEADISGIVAGGMLVGTGSGTMGILAKGTGGYFLRVNAGATALEWASSTGQIATGTYTGDGSTDQGVTGVGFQPIYVKIWNRATSDGDIGYVFETTDDMVDDNAAGMAMKTNYTTSGAQDRFVTNAIITLDADGFSVDDAGSDAHPNTNGQVYTYLAMS